MLKTRSDKESEKISNIISKGTAKQKAILIANNAAENSYLSTPILSEEEINQIVISLRRSKDRETYDLYIDKYRSLRRVIEKVQVSFYDYRYKLSQLEKLLIIRMINKDMADIVNELIELLPTTELKNRGLKLGRSVPDLPDYRHTVYRKNKISYEGSVLWQDTKKIRAELIYKQIHLKTIIQLVRDYMKETGLIVNFFKSYVREIDDWAKSSKDLALNLRSDLRVRSLDSITDEQEIVGELESDYKTLQIDKSLYENLKAIYLT